MSEIQELVVHLTNRHKQGEGSCLSCEEVGMLLEHIKTLSTMLGNPARKESKTGKAFDSIYGNWKEWDKLQSLPEFGHENPPKLVDVTVTIPPVWTVGIDIGHQESFTRNCVYCMVDGEWVTVEEEIG